MNNKRKLNLNLLELGLGNRGDRPDPIQITGVEIILCNNKKRKRKKSERHLSHSYSLFVKRIQNNI